MILSKKSPARNAAPAGAPAAEALELWGGSAGAGQTKMPDLSALLALARRNAVWIAAVALLVALLCFVAVRLVFNQYTATATLLFDPRNARVTPTQEVLSDIGPDSIAIESLVQVAKADGFLLKLIERQELTGDSEYAGNAASSADRTAASLDKLRDRLTIARRGATYVVDVTVKSGDPQKSARIANAAAEMIADNESDLRSGSNQRAADLIGGKLAQLRERVSSEDAAIAKLRADLKINDAGQGEALQERRVTELNQQLALANAHSGEARALVDQLREANFTAGGAAPTAIQSTVLSALRQDYARLSRQAADRESVLGARHPDVIAAKAQLDDVRRQVAAEKDRLIASAKLDYLQARKREASVADELHKAQAESGAMDQQAVQLRDLERTEKSDQAVYEQLLNRQKELSEIKGLTSNDIRLVSPAIAPTRTNMPKLSIVLAASVLLGLFAGFASAVARDRTRRTPRGSSPVPRARAVESDAIVPALSPAPPLDGNLVEGEAARWFAQICSSAPMQGVGRGGIVLVTSARAGEGKSTVAANVAACLASDGRDVLLMQLSGNPVVAARRGLGVVDVAAGVCALDDAVLWFGENSPSVLPLGGSADAAAGPTETLLSGAALRRLIHDCRGSFDRIVIDAPPILAAPALRALARLADSVLMVVEWDVTDAALLDQAMEDLDPGKTGVVLNKVDLARHGGFAPLKIDAATAQATGAAPVARERHSSAFAGPAESTKRTRRRRNAFGRAG
jgi:polysaccharide biosynthesis transport protein